MKLLRDRGKDFAQTGAVRRFGIDHSYRGMHDVAERSAFLIDEGGTVRGAWRYESSELPDLEELLSAARALPG
jgi:peroxiredoxin